MEPNKPVLYAEDEEDDIFLMQRAFKKAGVAHPLRTVLDGREAINYLAGKEAFADREQHPMPCLLLLDLNMPGRSGLEVLEWLRAQPTTATLPVLVFTSSNQEGDIQRATALGANGYLVKPGKPEDLLKLVTGIKDSWLS